jgi:hypothetical protein
MLLTVFDVRIDAVFKCSGCGAEHLLKARKNTIEWTTIIPEKTRKGTKPRTEPAPCNGPNPNPEIDAGRDETA